MTRITLTDEIRAELYRLREDTGVGASRLLRGRPIRLQKLNSSTVHQWISGKVLTAGKDELDYVLSAWKAVSKIIPVTQEMYDHLSAEQAPLAGLERNLLHLYQPYFHWLHLQFAVRRFHAPDTHGQPFAD